MIRLIVIIFFCLSICRIYAQYHPIPDENAISKLTKISDKAYSRTGLDSYDKSVVILYGDLGCDDILGEKKVSKELFEQGIKYGYHTKKKCLFKKEKYLAADIYYLDGKNNLLGYFNGQSAYPTTGSSESKVYSDLEKFIAYLDNEKYTQIFNLGCALDVSKYYAVNKNGEPVLLDENAFREGKDPASHIDKLD